MKVLRFAALMALALVSYPIGIVYGLLVRVFMWIAYLLTFDVAKMLIEVYMTGVRMSSVLNATAATWLKSWLVVSGSAIEFGGFYPVSAVIGHAYHLRQLTGVGMWVRDQLELLDQGHCERAAKRHGLIWN
jgi:hypothetical protein